MLTQKQHYELARRKVAGANDTFLELVKEGMTASDLRTNIARRPELWARFAKWLDVLPESQTESRT